MKLAIVLCFFTVLLIPDSYAFVTNQQITISHGASITAGFCTFTNCFNPQILDINVGDTVTWTNNDTVGHTATSGHPSDNRTGTVWDSSLIKAENTYTSPPFNSAGTYPYFCQVHPWMTGEIVVENISSPSVPEFPAGGMIFLVIASTAVYIVMRYKHIKT